MNSGLGKCKKNNPTSIDSGAVPGNGEQAQLVLGSLKLLSWPPTLMTGVIVSHLPGTFFCLSLSHSETLQYLVSLNP